MSRHSLDTIPKVQDGGLWCSKVAFFNDFKDPLLKFKSVLHQMTTIFETLGIWAFIWLKMFLDLSFPLSGFVVVRAFVINKCIYCRVFKLSAPNFYCCNFNGRAVPWVSPLEFVCKSRVERRVEISAWLSRSGKLDQLAKLNIGQYILSLSLVSKAESSGSHISREFKMPPHSFSTFEKKKNKENYRKLCSWEVLRLCWTIVPQAWCSTLSIGVNL